MAVRTIRHAYEGGDNYFDMAAGDGSADRSSGEGSDSVPNNEGLPVSIILSLTVF